MCNAINETIRLLKRHYKEIRSLTAMSKIQTVEYFLSQGFEATVTFSAITSAPIFLFF